MGLITCYVGDFRKGGTSLRITDLLLHPARLGAPLTIGSVFLLASGPAALDVALDWSRRGSVSQIPHRESFDVALLSDGLEKLLAGELKQPAIGLLIADYFDPEPGAYGMMFDLDVEDEVVGPRQGCAIFVGGIRQALLDSGDTITDDALREFVAYTAVHEIGHALNLWHVENSFMQPSPNPISPGPYEFVAKQREYLSLAANPRDSRFVLPGHGCADYGQRPDGWQGLSDDNTFAAPRTSAEDWLLLRVGLSHAAFHPFEPVELDVVLSFEGAGYSDSISVPNEMDPGYDTFQIWITDPAGERRRFKSLTRFCRSTGSVVISAGRPFHRDICIFRQRGGSPFGAVGRYQIQVAFRISTDRVLFSNTVESRVLQAEPASEAWRAGHEILASNESRKLLRFKSMSPTPYGYERLMYYAQTYASRPTAAAIEFALGKAILNTAKYTVGSTQTRKQLDDHARSHLNAAAASGALGPHHAEIAEALLAQLNGAPVPN